VHPVRIALLGTGFTLHTQLPAFRQVPQALVTHLVGRDLHKTQRLAAQHGIEHAGISVTEVLHSGAVDLVCVTTPVDLHRSMAEECLRAGVAVLCEKPMALNAQEAESMCAVADDSACLALIDHQLRFSPNLVRLRRLLRDGYIGKPMHVEVALRVGGHLDPRRVHNWWSEEARGGGVLGALGSHMIDLLRWTLGEVHSVCGSHHTFVADRPMADSLQRRSVTSDDHAAFWLVLGEHRVHASVTVSVVAHATDALRLEVSGRNGMLRIDADSHLWGSRRDPEMVAPQQTHSPELLDAENPLSIEQRRHVPDSVFGQAFAIYAGHLVRGIAENRERPWQDGPLRAAATFHDGLGVQRVLDALRRSHRERRWIDLL